MNFKNPKLNIFNTLDIAIIIIAASLLVATFFKINNRQIFMLFDRAVSSTVTVSVDTEEYDAGDFKVGEKIFFSDSKETVGTIVSVKNIKEKRYTAINQTLMYDYTDRNTGILIEIKTKIKENESKKYINSSVFTARGSKFSLCTAGVPAFECVVDDILISGE